MGWLQKLGSIFAPRNEVDESGIAWSAPGLFFGPAWGLSRRSPILQAYEAGMTMTTDEALKVSAVWACMDTIVRAVAPCPWNVYGLDNGKREVRTKDPLAYLLNTRANPWTTAIAFREGMLWSALAYGNGYAEIQFDGSGRVQWLWNLDPTRVTPITDESGNLVYRVNQLANGQYAVLESWRIFHLRGPSLTGYVGENVLSHAARSIASHAAAQQYAAAYFANGTSLSGYFTYPKALTPNDKAAFEKDWQQKNATGSNAKHKSPILPTGMEFKPLSVDPGSSQLLESRSFSVPDIARWFGVPLHLLADPQGSQGYGTNIEQGGIQFVNGCLHPWAERHEQEADYKLVPDRPSTRETRIDLSRHTKGAFGDRMTGYKTARDAGILNQNEIREMEGWNSVGSEGDAYLVSGSMKTIEDVIDPPEPALAPAPTPAADKPDVEEDDGDEAMMVDAARVAVVLDRFARKVAARRAGLARAGKSPSAVDAAAAELRAQAEPALLEEIGTVAPSRLSRAIDAVIAGEPAHIAAKRLVDE